MAEAKRTRRKMTKREYNTHIFALARNAKSPVQDIASQHYSGHWWQAPGLGAERSLDEEYEQNAIINGIDGGEQGVFSTDASDREDFRNKQIESLRTSFRKALKSHPEFKGKTAKELSQIADAYLSGKDHDSFKSQAVTDALQEVSDYVTGDGEVAMSEEREWRDKYHKGEIAKTDETTTAAASNEPVAPKNGTPKNGTPKAPATETTSSQGNQNTSQVPLRPREEQQADVASTSKYGRTGASDTGVRINGAPVEVGDTATRNHLKRAQRDAMATDAIEASEARKDAQNRARSGDRRRYQQYLADQDALDAAMNARLERKEAERLAKEQARKDSRFKNRTLVNMRDWENLGREGANNVDYSDPKNAEAKAKRDERIAALRDRLAELNDKTIIRDGETAKWQNGRMVVTDKDGKEVDTSGRSTTGASVDGQRYANDLYMYNNGRQRDVAGLRNLVEKAFSENKLTDAQIEGVGKVLDGWVGEANSRKNAMTMQEQRRNAELMASIRRQYGMEDKEVFDDASVLAYRDKVQSANRKQILESMRAGGGNDNYGYYGDAWKKLLDSGFDPMKTFRDALKDPNTTEAYNQKRMKIDSDSSLTDAEKERKRDQLKHQVIMSQAFKEAGIEDAKPADVGAIRRGDASLESDYETTVAQNEKAEAAAAKNTQGSTPLAPRSNKTTQPSTPPPSDPTSSEEEIARPAGDPKAGQDIVPDYNYTSEEPPAPPVFPSQSPTPPTSGTKLAVRELPDPVRDKEKIMSGEIPVEKPYPTTTMPSGWEKNMTPEPRSTGTADQYMYEVEQEKNRNQTTTPIKPKTRVTNTATRGGYSMQFLRPRTRRR